MRRCLQDYHITCRRLDRDLNTTSGCLFLSFVLSAGISFPVIGYLCITSTPCAPHAGEALLYSGSVIDVVLTGFLVLYIVRFITYSCVDPPPPLTEPPRDAYRPYGRRSQSV